ncbi:MAG: response regulator transcription factor [Fulvivirga sp.]
MDTQQLKFHKIAIIEDDEELNDAFCLLLKSIKKYNIVGSFLDFEKFRKRYRKLEIDLIIMDLELPGTEGEEAIKMIKKINPDQKILVVSAHESDERVLNAIASGASGFMGKGVDYGTLLNAIDSALKGNTVLSDKVAKIVLKSFQRNPNSPLTLRETEVLEHLAQGKTYHDISNELEVTYDTVKTHIQHIYWKLEVNNKSDALIKARTLNFIAP